MNKKAAPQETVEISEMVNTHGCTWNNPGGKTQYGFSTWPSASGTWLGSASGNAVTLILEKGLGRVISERPGAYGGTCRTIRVDRDELDRACQQHWKNLDAQDAQVDRSRCHYCGLAATSTGFFGEPVCPQCGA